MQRQISTTTTAPPTNSSPISKILKHQPATQPTINQTPDNDAKNSAAKLIASLLNGNSKSLTSTSSSTTTKTTTINSTPKTSATKLKVKTTLQPATTPKVATVTPNVVKDSIIAKGESLPSIVTAKVNSASNGITAASKPKLLKTTAPDHVVLRNLESWHDEQEGQIDDSYYQELVDSGNPNGWSADEMFKYNERRHKVLSNYSEKTLSGNYTTPLPKIKSKTTVRMATQLAKEIEQRVLAEGRITPESSDDDELFETERMKRVHSRQQKQLDQLKNLKVVNNNFNANHSSQGSSSSRLSSLSSNYTNNNNNNQNGINNIMQSFVSKTVATNHNISNHSFASPSARRSSNKSSSQYSNSSATPATVSLSSSPTLNDSNNIIIKPVTSSSRNILRTCLT